MLGSNEKAAARRRNLRGLALIAPLVLFLGAVFFAPLAGMLALSVKDRELAEVMPRTVAQLRTPDLWNGQGVPPDAVFEATARDLAQARDERTAGIAARRLNYDDSGLRSVVLATARALPREFQPGTDWKHMLISRDAAWGEPRIWQAIHRARGPVTDFYLLAALDMRRDGTGDIARVTGESALYIDVLARTFVIALSVTVLCLILALPTAHLLASAPPTTAGLLMLVLLVPLWTSVLVRSAAWLVVLQQNGLVNQFLQMIHVVSEPLQLIYNRTGVLIALTHILLPYAVLPLYSAMKGVPATQMRAASSLGAGPVESFCRIYMPQILPGISAGGLLVFILSLGYYITPLLVGSPSDQLLPYYIAFNTMQSVNWGLAAALGSLLLAATLLLYWLYARLVGVERIGLG